MKIVSSHLSHLLPLMFLLLFLPIGVLAQVDFATPSSTKDHYDMIIRDVDLIDGTGRDLQPGVDIYVENGIISAIVEEELNVTADTVINGAGRYAIPGLFDAHYHFINYRKRDLEDYKEQGKYLLHFGITNILITNGIIEDMQKFKKRIDTDKARGPRIFYTSRMATIPGAHPAKREYKDLFTEGENIEYVKDTLDIKQIVKTAMDEGAIAIKIAIEDGPTPPLIERMPASFIQKFSREANKFDLPLFAHISDMEEVKMSVENGVDALMHGALVQLPEDKELLKNMGDKNISWVFTNMISKATIFYPLNLQWLEEEPYEIFNEIYMKSISDPDGSKAERSRQILLNYFQFDSVPTFETFIKETMNSNSVILQEGVNIVVGTDTGGPSPYILPGISVHEEMEILQLSGINPLEVIKMATLNAAKMMGQSDSLGSVEDGKVADIVILDKNPLKNIHNTLSISTVIKDGKVQGRTEKH
ncbi:amidohydrolase family protein [Salegentibacter sp. F14]